MALDNSVASGNAVSLRELLGMVADRLDGRELVRFGARAADPAEPTEIRADVGRLRTPRRHSHGQNRGMGMIPSATWRPRSAWPGERRARPMALRPHVAVGLPFRDISPVLILCEA